MLAALRSRDFRLLWLSQSVSVIGDAVVIVAIGLYVTRLTHRPDDVGLVLGAYALPLVLFLLIGGVFADRLPRHIVMLSSDVVRAVLHGLLAVLIATGTVRIWLMVVIGLLYGTAEAFFRPAYTGLVPQTVAEDDIQAAQALGGMSAQVAEMASPALATLLVLGFDGSIAFGFDAATFVVSALLLSRVRPRVRGPSAVSASVLAELREGWGAVRDRPWVLWTVVAFSLAVFTALAPFYVLGATVARTEYGSESVFGWSNAAFGVGTVTGAVLGARWRPRYPMRTGVIVTVPWAASTAVYALGIPLPVMYVALVAGGLGAGAFVVWWETALATRVPPHLLSRVSAWDWMGSLALLPLGYILAGSLARSVGARPELIWGGCIGAGAMATSLLSPSTWRLGQLPASSVSGAGGISASVSD